MALTTAGQQAVDGFAPRLADVINRSVHDTLTPRQIATLVDLLGRVEEASLAMVAEPSD